MAQLLTLSDEQLRELIIAADTDAATREAAVNVILQRKRSAIQLAEQTILAAQQLLEQKYGWPFLTTDKIRVKQELVQRRWLIRGGEVNQQETLNMDGRERNAVEQLAAWAMDGA